jgi:DNA-binding transcriptional regulator YdaS (Cro superfamily)
MVTRPVGKSKQAKMSSRKSQDPAVNAAIKGAGGLRALGRALGVAHTSLLGWTSIPAKHLLRIEEITGIPREQLRPDLFRKSR